MKRLIFIASVACGLVLSSAFNSMQISANEKLPEKIKVSKLTAYPAKPIELDGLNASTQVILFAELADGSIVDATRIAAFQTDNKIIALTNGLVRPISDGSTKITANIDGQTLEIPVTVKNVGSQKEISFVNDVQPILSKLGCNQGTCHGAQAGKNGFKLSLRGYDPVYDFRALTDDLEGRRFNRAAPERSLMLLKPTGAVPHVGGVLWQPGESNYDVVKAWIAQGVKQDLKQPKVVSIEVFPKNPTVHRIGDKQQFAVIANYANGVKKDVTALSFVESSNTEVATVDKFGIATTLRRGESTMLARYEGAYSASTVVVMGNREGFEWKAQPVFNHIDELVDKKLQAVKVNPSEICDDATFIRRISLDLTGLPPSSTEVVAFLNDKKETQLKRVELIDRLIASDAFVEHWTNKWCDLLQVNRKFLGEPGAKALREWVRKSVKENKPYDQFAYEVLNGSGSNVEQPTASYYKILRTADAVMENTTQLFLAIRFNCNKCHDHPFEKWTQDQYYQLAAFFAQVDRKEDPKYKGQKLGGTAVEKPLPLVELVSDLDKGEIKHERTGKDAVPLFPFPHEEMPNADSKRREQLAKWLTSAKNPYFAKSFVNRVWSYMIGVGIIEPVDDIRAGNPPTNPELLERLTVDFVATKFDFKKLIRTICVSRTYQLSVATNPWNKDDEYNFAKATARRLPAEVLYDTVHVSTGTISKLPGLPPGSRAAQLLDSTADVPGGFLDLFGKPVRESACECERSTGMMLGPVLAMVSGPVIGDAVQDQTNRIAKLTMIEKDDTKVVREIYLSVLNRYPTEKEMQEGVKAMTQTKDDFDALQSVFAKKKKAFDDHLAKTVDLQKKWEEKLHLEKPTEWVVMTAKSANAKKVNKKDEVRLEVQKDNSILAKGKGEMSDVYNLQFDIQSEKEIKAIRLEVLSDDSLPAKGPGRANNGNFVLNELTANYKEKAAVKDDKKESNAEIPAKQIKFSLPQASFSQDSFPISNAIDNNKTTGWAISPQTGRDHQAFFMTQSIPASKGITMTIIMDQSFGTDHVIGKFRFSYTIDPKPKLTSMVSKELKDLIEVETAKRTEEQKNKLRKYYLDQDKEYQRLEKAIANKPPSDPRVLGAQDLTWALLNSPGFLFNR